jgi:hypothetical protein
MIRPYISAVRDPRAEARPYGVALLRARDSLRGAERAGIRALRAQHLTATASAHRIRRNVPGIATGYGIVSASTCLAQEPPRTRRASGKLSVNHRTACNVYQRKVGWKRAGLAQAQSAAQARETSLACDTGFRGSADQYARGNTESRLPVFLSDRHQLPNFTVVDRKPALDTHEATGGRSLRLGSGSRRLTDKIQGTGTGLCASAGGQTFLTIRFYHTCTIWLGKCLSLFFQGESSTS